MTEAASMSSFMLDEVKPKRHRRRQRSRKKKAAVTIESIIPGRAPMGAESLLHHVESRKPTLPGAWPEDGSEEQNVPPSSSPLQLQSPISTPSRQRGSNTRSPLSPLSNLAKPDTVDSPSPSHSPLLTRTLPHSLRSVTHTGTIQESRTLPNDLFLSPLPIKARRSLSTMTTQRLSLVSPSTPTRASRISIQDEPHELDSFEHLASSQPISLSQLCARANSRLRTARASKNLHNEKLDDDGTKDTSNTTGLRDVNHTKRPSRLSMIHHANSKECRLKKYKEDVLTPSHYYSESQDEASQEQDSENTWYSRGDIHPHRNPLSYSCGYDSPFIYSGSGPYDAISSSPFTKNTSPHNEFGTWPAAKSYRKLFSDASPGHSYLNNMLAGSSLSIYRESFDRPENQSPYESLRTQRSSHNHPDIRVITANMQPLSGEPYVERRMTYLPTHYDALHERVPDPGITYTGDQSSTPVSSPVQTADQRGSAQFAEQAENPSPEEVKQRSVKDEVTAFLRAIVQSSHPDARQTELRSLSHETKTPLSEHNSPEGIAEKMTVRRLCADTDNEPKHSPSAASWNSPKSEEHKPASVTRVSYPQNGYLYEEIMEKMARMADKSKSKTVRPPPGIPDPVVQNTPMGLSYLGRTPTQVQERISEAKSWFSTDNRGEQQLRQQVAGIAENYSQRFDRFKGNGAFSDSNTAKQMTLLLGNVVINLHSYGSPDSQDVTKQGQSFANFGRVKSRYCEPSLGGRRSYFDQDPSTNQWKRSAERMLSSHRDGSEDCGDSSEGPQGCERE